MPITAKLSYLRIAPRKVRLVADLLRGKPVEEAQNVLHFTVKRTSQPLLKLLKSAVSNAENSFQLKEKDLYISKIIVDEGPKLKRWIARARGKGNEIQKKTSHITVVLDEFIRKPKEARKERVEKAKIIARTEKYPEIKKVSKSNKLSKGQAKFRPGALETAKPKKEERGLKRVFRRTAF